MGEVVPVADKWDWVHGQWSMLIGLGLGLAGQIMGEVGLVWAGLSPDTCHPSRRPCGVARLLLGLSP